MHISLILCTRNRADRLGSALAALERLRLDGPWELIVVDNGSTDSTWAILEEFRARSCARLVLAREPKPGLCRARNRACAVARGEIIAFTDDDCYPAPDFLEQLAACFGDSALGFLGGRVLQYDQSALKLTLKESELRIEYAPRSVIWPGAMHGANMAFRRAALKAIGGFDELLGAGTAVRSGGDSDALARACAAGFAGAYDPRPVVWHDHGRTYRDQASALHAGYDLGRGGFFARALLESSTRSLYRRPVARHAVGLLRERQLGVLARELRGGSLYLWQRLFAWRRRAIAL